MLKEIGMPLEIVENNRFKDFSEAYSQLSPQAKIILQLLSVMYANTARTDLAYCLQHCRMQSFPSSLCTPQALKPILRELTRNDLIQADGQHLRCASVFLNEATLRAIEAGTFKTMVGAVAETTKYTAMYYGGNYKHYDYCVRDIRIALFRRDLDAVRKKLEICAKQFSDSSSGKHPFYLICANPFDPHWISALPEPLIADVLGAILNRAFAVLEKVETPFSFLECFVSRAETSHALELRDLLALQLIVRGKFAQARAMVENQQTPCSLALLGWLDFLSGEDEKAIAHYETALSLLKKATRKRKIFFADVTGIFYILALIRSGDHARLNAAEDYLTYIVGKQSHDYLSIYWLLLRTVEVQKGQIKSQESIKEACRQHRQADALTLFFQALVLFWMDPKSAKNKISLLDQMLPDAKRAGYEWLASEVALLLSALGQKTLEAEKAELTYKENKIVTLVCLVAAEEPWELLLNALVHLKKPEEKQQTGLPQTRLIWLVDLKGDSFAIQPLEQKRTSGGKWSKGRPPALKRLKTEATTLDFLSKQDVRICSCIKQKRIGYYGREYYEFDLDEAIPAMVGHPLLFLDPASDLRLELVQGDPELVITSDGNKLDLRLSPILKEGAGIALVREGPTRLKVIKPGKDHLQIASILRDGLSVPLRAKDKVLKAIESISSLITVHSDVGIGKDSMEMVAADHRAHILLRPFGRGLRLEFLVRPFSSRGSYYRPGIGGETIIAEFDGVRVQARRNPDAERENVRQAVSACPTLERLEENVGEWKIEEPEDCMDLLLELQALGDKVALEWPEGERFRVRPPASMSQLKISIRQAKEWFSVTGELRVDESLVIDMQRLMQLIGETPGRFIPLGEGEFLALTQEFRKRMDELRAFSEVHERQVRFHPLAAPAIKDFTAAVGALNVDSHWKDHIKRIEEAQDLRPNVPSTLRAELRDYQIEGFNWLARLAHWGVGACLADDMGLGKTIQSLAQILTRAAQGPSLVVAPTSVCMNWESEARRFAPTLNVVLFGGSQRKQMLDTSQPFDLVICSYTLLQQEADMLAEVYWQTIVLDEAQAIKNMATKRSQAAMALQGRFKTVTTGTPIENHLGELWNILRFTNPGLLGSLKSFNAKFAFPIEKDQDKKARSKLKRLIQPFILRRTKNQVSEQLPPRTEITLKIEMSPEESALYETIRRGALARIAGVEGPTEQKHFQILAALMKLRRCCCNPRLVVPDTSIPSTKLAAFGEILEDLQQNQHKVLVFSQFVDHLTILRELLNERGTAYQYLDGSTPPHERKKRVDAFQSGQGDVFLISLKAGGCGLNLTAADYVIHMDPWWNPAVEDQASDRAHRIGQDRPVTIYRLVTKGTIEEKIVELHSQKRDLADSLLEGSDMSGRISAKELFGLLQESGR